MSSGQKQQTKLDYRGRVHSDQMVLGCTVNCMQYKKISINSLNSKGSRVVRQGRLNCMSSGQKALKGSLELKNEYHAQVHSGQIVVRVVRHGGLTV